MEVWDPRRSLPVAIPRCLGTPAAPLGTWRGAGAWQRGAEAQRGLPSRSLNPQRRTRARRRWGRPGGGAGFGGVLRAAPFPYPPVFPSPSRVFIVVLPRGVGRMGLDVYKCGTGQNLAALPIG